LLPLLALLLFYGASATVTSATIKWMADGDDIPSEPTEHHITERTTVLTHYPDGGIEGSDNSYDEYLRLSAQNKMEMEDESRDIIRSEGWNESKIERIVEQHLTTERHLQRDYAQAIAANVSGDELVHKHIYALMALRYGRHLCE